MTQPNEKQKQELLARILNSPEFHESKRYMELLQYLVDKSEKVGSLKEAEIAHEVFGKDSKFDPSTDPLIRSYISNLRKKLEHYYLTTQDDCLFRLEIPKGQYLVKYTPKTEVILKKQTLNKWIFIYPAIIVVLITFLIFREIQIRNYSPESTLPIRNNVVWKEFTQNASAPVLIALGDYILLSEKGKRAGRSFVRVPRINSLRDLQDSIKMYPNKFGKLEISEVSHVGAGAALGLSHILQFLNSNNIKSSVKLSKEITWDDIEKNNIIFIGTLKTLYKLDTLLARTNISYELNPNSLSVFDKKLNQQKQFKLNWLGGNYENNYSLVLKQKLAKANNIVLLTGFSEVGVMGAVTSSLDNGFISKVEEFVNEKLNESLPQFELIVESEGLRYNVFKSQIKYFNTSINK